MGWASGSSLCSKVLDQVLDVLWDNKVPANEQVELTKVILQAFEEEDCDTLDELYDDDDEIISAALDSLGYSQGDEGDDRWHHEKPHTNTISPTVDI